MRSIPNAKRLHLKKQRLWLLPQKALFWEKKKILMIADPHLGKAEHFRRNGIPVPGSVNTTNLELLDRLLKAVEVEHLITLGDLFHSRHNREWDHFFEWRAKHRALEVTLVIGNHDILERDTYHSSRINLFHKLRIGPFLLVHDLSKVQFDPQKPGYLLSGHVHPAIQLRGKGRQSMKLPCFYFGNNQGILPAFGEFTGTHVIKPKPEDKVFAVVDGHLIPIQELT
ncbi:ligase-associated DNA damage response endonuclease PdeM [Aliifodinibius sp. S!AR15-10]|uniref:ligase-associated DNA damage response endonuclease PdeM n=1 Tax=Aliifodinibius sp. S!AR15-10 TaxID=2950437 RepID=UPI0028585C31|nr:ligase-associated DNA damage response endonuclease PdeM [Aliifodinibius sp. S!AR15-10]MDR8392113.1 ligase-associated DNA damage response endonuclease PdeM [Aliifodinibius sp. S!AR15-10]